MQTQQPEIEVKFTVVIPGIPEVHRLEAERKAREAYVMTLLQHGDISAGRAAKLLGIDRWRLSELMDVYDISPFSTQTREELEREVAHAKRTLEKNSQ